MRIFTRLLFLVSFVVFNGIAQAQLPLDGQKQAEILQLLNQLPPETMKKIETLGQIIQQDLKEGKLTNTQLREELQAGHLEQTLRRLNPEAAPLLDDIADSMKDHPNADTLPDLLNGMVGSDR